MWSDKPVVWYTGFVLKRGGDFRTQAVNRYAGRIAPKFARLVEEVAKEHRRDNLRQAASFVVKTVPSPLQKSKLAKAALKKRSRTKAIDSRLRKYEANIR